MQPLDEVVLVGPAFGGAGRELDFDALLLEQHPGVHVGRELTVRHEDHVAAPQGQRAGREVQAVAGVGRERDLGGVGVEESGHGDARRLQSRLELAVREQVGSRPLFAVNSSRARRVRSGMGPMEALFR